MTQSGGSGGGGLRGLSQRKQLYIWSPEKTYGDLIPYFISGPTLLPLSRQLGQASSTDNTDGRKGKKMAKVENNTDR